MRRVTNMLTHIEVCCLLQIELMKVCGVRPLWKEGPLVDFGLYNSSYLSFKFPTPSEMCVCKHLYNNLQHIFNLNVYKNHLTSQRKCYFHDTLGYTI